MGNILNTHPQFRPCTGCGVCALSCANGCIVMKIDSDGFVRPYVSNACTQCGMCIKNCVKFDELDEHNKEFYSNKTIFSFKNKDSKSLISSSSGGFIESVYSKYLELGFILCGAIYDSYENVVKHKIVTTKNDIIPLLGSKYLQSLTNECFEAIKCNNTDKYVIVGTPCQIYGLHKWAIAHKRREDFILIDFFCAGVPSYNLWNVYLKYIDKLYAIGDIQSISFRDKINSDWHHYGIKIKGSNGEYYKSDAAARDLFFKLFLSDSCKRLSCSARNCPFRTQYCFSDIRVGDYWGGEYKEDTTGVSVVIANTIKGNSVLSKFNSLVKESEIQVSNLKNPHKCRAVVMDALKRGESIGDVANIITNNKIVAMFNNIHRRICSRNNILIVNNYSMKDSLRQVNEGILPKHHAWGIDKLEEYFNLRFTTYRCPEILSKIHIARLYYFYFQLKVLFLSIGCDQVYAAASPLINLLARLRYQKIISKRLYMVVHHPRNFSLKRKTYDKLFFITRVAYNQAIVDYKDKCDLFIYNEWGPDMDFYKIKRNNCLKNKGKISFISIGKANRDHDVFLAASRNIDVNTFIICTKKSRPTNYNPETDTNIKVLIQNDDTLISGNLMSYDEMITILSNYDVVVIPIPHGHGALCGLTSFNDAIALGKPVIIADSANLGIDVEKEGFGFIYKSGDVQDLREKMNRFVQMPSLIESMGRKAYEYACVNDNSKFSDTILVEIKS